MLQDFSIDSTGRVVHAGDEVLVYRPIEHEHYSGVAVFFAVEDTGSPTVCVELPNGSRAYADVLLVRRADDREPAGEACRIR